MRRGHGEVSRGDRRCLLWLVASSRGDLHEPRSFFWLLGEPPGVCGGMTEEPRNDGVEPPAGVEPWTGAWLGVMTCEGVGVGFTTIGAAAVVCGANM